MINLIEKAMQFVDAEIRSYELAPEINGCEMTPEWAEMLGIFRAIKSALEKAVDG